MTLSPTAASFAAEISAHDWSDAPYRIDRAGHNRKLDRSKLTSEVLTAAETEFLETNVMWVTAQVLAHQESDFDVHEYAEACGVAPRIRLRSNGTPSGGMDAGLRIHTTPSGRRQVAIPGSASRPVVRVATNEFGLDAAVCGEVKLHKQNPAFGHNFALLQPRTFVVTTYDGMAYGQGYIGELQLRGDWYVVVWDSFWSVANPFKFTVTGGRHYADDADS